MLGRKQRIDNLDDMRNRFILIIRQFNSRLPVSSLGDKIYKHPDYSSDYFKDGGLIPGANIS